MKDFIKEMEDEIVEFLSNVDHSNQLEQINIFKIKMLELRVFLNKVMLE